MTLASTNWGAVGMLVLLGTVFVLLVWNAGLREERDDRIRANVRLCEEIKNYRAERDMAQLELSRANVRYEQSHRRAEAMWKERDAALARVAELVRYVEQLREPLLQEATDLGQEIESAPPPPEPKWTRCPNGCIDGVIHEEPNRNMTCCWCVASGRPGWVKETLQ